MTSSIYRRCMVVEDASSGEAVVCITDAAHTPGLFPLMVKVDKVRVMRCVEIITKIG